MKGFWGGVMMAAGILIAGLSGLCSGIVAFSGMSGGGADLTLLPLVLLFGGPPFLIGLGLFFWGRRLSRIAARERVDVSRDFE